MDELVAGGEASIAPSNGMSTKKQQELHSFIHLLGTFPISSFIASLV